MPFWIRGTGVSILLFVLPAGRDFCRRDHFVHALVTYYNKGSMHMSEAGLKGGSTYLLSLTFPQLNLRIQAGQSPTLVGTTSLFDFGNNQVSDRSPMTRSRQEPCSPITSNPRQSSSQTATILLLHLFTIAMTIKPRTPLIYSYSCELDSVATPPDTDQHRSWFIVTLRMCIQFHAPSTQ